MCQGLGIGQELINYDLDHLRLKSVEMVFTYGAPDYHYKTGFQQISQNVVRPLYPLSRPIGWLAQSLDSMSVSTMDGKTQCVEAFSDQKYW